MRTLYIEAIFLLAAARAHAAYLYSSNYEHPQRSPDRYIAHRQHWTTVPITTPIDLSHPLDEQTNVFPGVEPFSVKDGHEHPPQRQEYFYATRDICLGEHAGTHMDAPYHFYEKGKKIGDIPVNKLLADAVVIDGESTPNATIGLKEFRDWLKKHGPLPSRCVVLFRFNWSRHFWDRAAYLGSNYSSLEFPGITPELAEELAETTEVVGVGLDTASIDPGRSTEMRAHRFLAKGDKYILENLLLPMSLPLKGWSIISMPIRITNGTGAPSRVVGVPRFYNTASSLTTSVIILTGISAFGRVLAT